MAILVVGLDIGGSKTHAVLSDGERVLAEAYAGSANIPSVGRVAAGAALSDVLQVLGVALSSVAVVCAGAAGIESDRERVGLAELIGERVPGARVIVVHDTRLLLATAGVEHGVALICGTGSVAWGVAPDQRWVRAGGWGYLLGDEGSGYAVAAAAVRHALGLADRALAPDRLSAALLTRCGLGDIDELLSHFYARTERRYWAHTASVVFELAQVGDKVCDGLVDSAAHSLCELVAMVCTRLSIAGPVIGAGGQLVHQPLLASRLRTRLATYGIEDVRILDRDPVHGAVVLALKEMVT